MRLEVNFLASAAGGTASAGRMKKKTCRSTDCFSAYNPQNAGAKQKCLAHLERDLEALQTSRFEGNRECARQVKEKMS